MKNNNLYNDKELFDDADLNWYDYGFRNYDPQIGRFPQLDPLTDDYPELTPYQYASNDPIANIDIDGLEGGNVITDFSYTYTKAASSFAFPVVSQSSNASKSLNLFKLSARFVPAITNIAESHSEQSTVSRQLKSNMQAQLSNSSRQDASTVSSCCNYFVSDQQKTLNAQQTSDAGYNSDNSINFLSRVALNKTWNNFANNIVFSPAVDIAGLVVGTGELSFAFREARTATELSDLFETGKIVKASELINFAEKQGWRETRNPNGPLKFLDRNGIERITIKKGSARTLGSEGPHVEIRNASGKRIDRFGNKVTRSSIGNHTLIHYDLR